MQNHELKPQSGPADCPTDSELAALLDDILEEPRAEEVRRHLQGCPDCFEIYAGAVRFEVERGGAEVIPFKPPAPPPAPDSRRQHRGWYAAAAGLLAASFSGYLLVSNLAGPSRPTSYTLADLASAAKIGANLPNNEVRNRVTAFRDDDAPRLNPFERRFMIGQSAALLQAALGVSDAQALLNLDTTLVAAMHGLGGEKMDGLQRHFNEQADRLEKLAEGAPLAADEGRAAREQLEILLGTAKGRESDYQDLGVFAEAGRLASQAGSPDFFKAEKNRKFLRWLQREQKKERPAIGLNAEARGALERIASAWPTLGDEADYSSLSEEFDRLESQALEPSAPSR